MKKILRILGSLFVLWLIAGITTPGTSQEYFGRNKVQYEDFDFKILKTDNFDIYFYPSEKPAATDAGRMIERWYKRFSTFYDHEIKSRQPLILYANHADFQQTNVISGLISPGTGGVTEGIKNRIVLPLTGNYADNNHVLGHELVHAFQYDIVKSGNGDLRAMNRLPLWFIEGMAEYLSIGREDALTAMWMRDAVLHDDFPTIEKMTRNPEYFPYRFGHAFWAFVGGSYGDDVIPLIYQGAMRASLDSTFDKILGQSGPSLSKDWKADVEETYRPELESRTLPEDVGQPIFAEKDGFNLAPSVSPDGKYVAFLSRRDLFTIDLYLADARTGKILKKLVSSTSDRHFDALRFIDAAGAWSPSGKMFAFPVFKDGDNAIAIVDVDSRDVEQTITRKEVDAISNLAWSPGGDRIAFSGISGGVGDLFIYNLRTKETERLTHDRYAELHPAWAPDGRTLAFATDRGDATDFEKFVFGKMKIGLLDVESRDIELLAMSEDVKHINPQFSPDGRSLYFVSDPRGFSDIFRYSFETQRFFRVTNIATGVTGITELSPALSVAKDSGRLMFSVFNHRNYHVYALTSEQARGEELVEAPDQLLTDSNLPPLGVRGNQSVREYLTSEQSGLPVGTDYSVNDYNPSLSLVGVGRATIGTSVDRFGTAVGGAVSLVFSDILGNRVLGVASQINGGLKELGGQVYYMNRRNRLNWGGVVGHIPYRTFSTALGPDTTLMIGNEEVSARSVTFIEEHTFIDRGALVTEYPLSTNRRLEFNAGFTRLSYSVDAQRVFVAGGSQITSPQDVDFEAPDPVNLVQASAAYVGDYSFYGFTSPVRGSRYRLEVEPTVGTLNYITVLADYRKYFFMQPFSLGFRLLHTGRYFGDSESSRLSPLFLGFQTFVRGYDVNSFNFAECTETDNPNACPEFDRLIGSRIGVFNAEFRIPLLGVEQYGLINFPFLPTELAFFFDAGIAWTQDNSPTLRFARESTERIPVFSTGAAARISLFGALPLQFYYAYPFQRPNKGWQFGLLLAPGW